VSKEHDAMNATETKSDRELRLEPIESMVWITCSPNGVRNVLLGIGCPMSIQKGIGSCALNVGYALCGSFFRNLAVADEQVFFELFDFESLASKTQV
jgi:hypothetical protein